jgi:hypothetical protein
MAIAPVYNVPGVQSDRTAVQRRVMRQGAYEMFAGGGIINGATARDPGNTSDVDKLRAGVLMGLRTSDDQWSPSILGTTTNAEADASVAVETGEFVGDEVIRRIGATGDFKLTGPASAGGVVRTATVTYSAEAAGTLTVTALVDAFIAGSFIQPTDGSEYPRSFIPDGFPVKMTDVDGVSIDTEWPCIPIGGVVDASQLINWPSDVSLRQWIINWLNYNGARFHFDHITMGE